MENPNPYKARAPVGAPLPRVASYIPHSALRSFKAETLQRGICLKPPKLLLGHAPPVLQNPILTPKEPSRTLGQRSRFPVRPIFSLPPSKESFHRGKTLFATGAISSEAPCRRGAPGQKGTAGQKPPRGKSFPGLAYEDKAKGAKEKRHLGSLGRGDAAGGIFSTGNGDEERSSEPDHGPGCSQDLPRTGNLA
jgi:hypothetical protein